MTTPPFNKSSNNLPNPPIVHSLKLLSSATTSANQNISLKHKPMSKSFKTSITKTSMPLLIKLKNFTNTKSTLLPSKNSMPLLCAKFPAWKNLKKKRKTKKWKPKEFKKSTDPRWTDFTRQPNKLHPTIQSKKEIECSKRSRPTAKEVKKSSNRTFSTSQSMLTSSR